MLSYCVNKSVVNATGVESIFFVNRIPFSITWERWVFFPMREFAGNWIGENERWRKERRENHLAIALLALSVRVSLSFTLPRTNSVAWRNCNWYLSARGENRRAQFHFSPFRFLFNVFEEGPVPQQIYYFDTKWYRGRLILDSHVHDHQSEIESELDNRTQRDNNVRSAAVHNLNSRFFFRFCMFAWWNTDWQKLCAWIVKNRGLNWEKNLHEKGCYCCAWNSEHSLTLRERDPLLASYLSLQLPLWLAVQQYFNVVQRFPYERRSFPIHVMAALW